MPVNNAFQPQQYTDQRPSGTYELITPSQIHDAATMMSASVALLLRANVRVLYLVHGTLAGTDAWGTVRLIRRVWPELAEVLGEQSKRLVDNVTRDVGNYTSDFAACLQEAGARQLAGHGVYTTHAWLPFHLRQVALRFYSRPAEGSPASCDAGK